MQASGTLLCGRCCCDGPHLLIPPRHPWLLCLLTSNSSCEPPFCWRRSAQIPLRLEGGAALWRSCMLSNPSQHWAEIRLSDRLHWRLASPLALFCLFIPFSRAHTSSKSLSQEPSFYAVLLQNPTQDTADKIHSLRVSHSEELPSVLHMHLVLYSWYK